MTHLPRAAALDLGTLRDAALEGAVRKHGLHLSAADVGRLRARLEREPTLAELARLRRDDDTLARCIEKGAEIARHLGIDGDHQDPPTRRAWQTLRDLAGADPEPEPAPPDS